MTYSKLNKADLFAWATERCLLEHLDEPGALTKKELLAEVRSALLWVDMGLETVAAGTGAVRYKGDVLDSLEGRSRPVEPEPELPDLGPYDETKNPFSPLYEEAFDLDDFWNPETDSGDYGLAKRDGRWGVTYPIFDNRDAIIGSSFTRLPLELSDRVEARFAAEAADREAERAAAEAVLVAACAGYDEPF